MTTSTLHDFELRDPAALIARIDRRVDLVEDSAYVVLVHHPSTEQRIVEIRALELPALLDDDEDISEDLCRVALSFGLPDVRRPSHSLVTVLVRPGRCVLGPNEAVWLSGWRYSNHLTAAYDGSLFLVTEHGWLHFYSDLAGHSPAMRPRRSGP